MGLMSLICKLKGKRMSLKKSKIFINIFMKGITEKKLIIKTKIVIIIFSTVS